MSKIRVPYLIIALCGMIMVLLLLLESKGSYQLYYSSGYGVDSDENVFIAHNNGEIYVYQDNELVRSIPAPTSRGYRMTIENDAILIGTGDYYYTLTLNGDILSKSEDSQSTVISNLQHKRICSPGNGKQYKICSLLGRTRIIDIAGGNGRIVYQMPMFVFALKVVKSITILCLILSIIWVVALSDSHWKKGT